MKLTYVGPHDAVDVAGLGKVERNQDVEVVDDLAEELLEQPRNWQPSSTHADVESTDEETEE